MRRAGRRAWRGAQVLAGHAGAAPGAAANPNKEKDLRNVGPSVQYKLRDANGQAREFNNYMLPVQLDGQTVFLAGMRESPNEPFRYLRIPADDQSSVADWMRLRARCRTRMRGEAARRFAEISMPGADKADLRKQLAESAMRALDLFAGATRMSPDAPPGGFTAIAAFLENRSRRLISKRLQTCC
jgi:cytochrome c biogenesis protein